MIKYPLKSFSYLSISKKCTFVFTLILIYIFKPLKILLFLLILIILFLEFIVIFQLFYKFYYCYLTNQYHCLDLNYIFQDYINKSCFGCFYLYIYIGAFKKFYFIIKKKEITIFNIFILIIILTMHIPVRGILLIYDVIEITNITYFLKCKKKKKLKDFFLHWMRQMCRNTSSYILIEDQSKIEIFNKKIYY